MSDTAVTTDPAPAPPADPVSAPTASPADTTAPPTEPAAPPAETDPFDSPDTRSFDRGYVEKIRNEAAERRVALKPYEEAFEGYDQSDRDVWLTAAQLMRTEPETVMAWMRDQAAEFFANEPPAPNGDQPNGNGPPDGDRPLTAAELDQWYAEKRQSEENQRAQAEAEKGVYEQIRTATGIDQQDPMAVAILSAAKDNNWDLAKGIDWLKQRDQKIIEAAIARMKGDADTSAVTPPVGGAGREEDKLPSGFGADFSARIRSMIESQH